MQARRTPVRGSGRGRARRAAALALVVPLALVAPLPGAAQEETPQPEETEMHLVAAPIAYGPDDRLRVRLRITNAGAADLEGVRIRVGIHDRVQSRSALRDSFDAPPGFESSALPVPLEDTIGAGQTRDVTVDEPVASFPTLAGSVEGGVFPATFSLQEETGAITFATVTVPLIYHRERPERPLDVHVLLPLNESARRDPSGSFGGEEPTLMETAAEGGWLDNYLDVLEEATSAGGPRRPLRISIAATPRLLEELRDVADGAPVAEGDEVTPDSPGAAAARRALERLRLLLGRDGVEAILVPYAAPDMPSLVENLSLRHTVEQFSAAEQVWEEVMGLEPVPDWLFPPEGRLDAPSLEQLQLLGRARKIILSEGAVAPNPAAAAGCPEPFLSFTCAIRVQTSAGTTEGLLVDGLIERALARLGVGRTEDRLILQQVFAETAMVHAEIPGTEGRIIQITLPKQWRPEGGLARTLLMGLRTSPWIRTRPADGGLRVSSQVAERVIVDRAPAPDGGPDDRFYAEVERSRILLDSYAAMVPAGSQRLQRLRRNLLVAASGSWLPRQNEAGLYLTGTIDEVQDEFSKIGITGSTDVTLTSKRGPLQIVISNETSNPAQLVLRFVSPDLRFDEPQIVDLYEPGSHPLTLEPTATGSGVFQVVIRLETTDGHLVDEERIVVRSTSFNQVALGITVGAFAFLVLFYVFKAVRKRAVEDESSTSA